MRKFWLEWVSLYEGFSYSETVTESELINRIQDKTIYIEHCEELFDID